MTAGHLADLTIKFGEESWQTHKALACSHSKWFAKAAIGGYEVSICKNPTSSFELQETINGVVTLHDEPEFAAAIDCMVSYFYKAGYDATTYDTPKALLHPQVAIIADKYDCASLYSLAKTTFADTIASVEIEDWAIIASFVYGYTITEAPAHRELMNPVVETFVSPSHAKGGAIERCRQ